MIFGVVLSLAFIAALVWFVNYKISGHLSQKEWLTRFVALAWEKDDMESERMVFRFGQTQEEINDILYSRDLILLIDKKEVYEN